MALIACLVTATTAHGGERNLARLSVTAMISLFSPVPLSEIKSHGSLPPGLHAAPRFNVDEHWSEAGPCYPPHAYVLLCRVPIEPREELTADAVGTGEGGGGTQCRTKLAERKMTFLRAGASTPRPSPPIVTHSVSNKQIKCQQKTRCRHRRARGSHLLYFLTQGEPIRSQGSNLVNLTYKPNI